MFKRMKIFLIAGAAMVVSSMAGDLQAATVQCGNVGYTVETADQSTALCASGNLNEGQGATITFDEMVFGLGISDSGASAGGSSVSWATQPIASSGTAGVLNWGISVANDWMGTILLELKQANSYALFDVTGSCDFAVGSCAGTWSTFGPGKTVNDLSHARAWVRDGEVPPVPLPAAGFLMFAAVFGLGCLRRRVA